MTNYIDANKLIAEIDKRLMSVNLEELGNNGSHRVWAYNDVKDLITSLQREQPELPPIGYAETYYHKGLRDGIIKGQNGILKGLEETEKRKAAPVLVIKQEQPEVNLEKELIQWHKCHFKKAGTYEKYSGFYLKNSSQLDLARYFYKIGLSARKEVDIEKEIQEHIKECLDIKFPTTDIEQIKKDVAYTARKFYELGLNAREK